MATPDVPEQGRRMGRTESPDVALNTPNQTRERRLDRRPRQEMMGPMSKEMEKIMDEMHQRRRAQSAGPLGGYDEYAE